MHSLFARTQLAIWRPPVILRQAILMAVLFSHGTDSALAQNPQPTKNSDSSVFDNARVIAELATRSPNEVLAAVVGAKKEGFDVGLDGLRMLKASSVPDHIITAIVRKKAVDVDNQLIVSLSAAGVSSAEIVDLIHTTPAARNKLDDSLIGLAGLRGAGVEEEVVEAVDVKSLIDQDEDIPVLAALGSRFSGGTVIGNGPLEVTPAVLDDAGNITTNAMVSTQQFSQAATYLAFEMQPVWRVIGKTDPRVSVSPIVNARLTTIAVADPTLIAEPNDSFLQSEKAVQFQFGGVVDIHAKSFTLGKKRLRWSFGPIFRFMQQSVTDSERTARIWNLEDDLFEAWTAGGRISLFHERDVAESKLWRPVAYIDFSKGSFENYEQARFGGTPAADNCLRELNQCLVLGRDLPSEDEYNLSNRRRLYVESRLMLKYIYLGFDLNSGPQGDDVRFIGGLTMSLDRFFKKTP